MIQVNLLPDVKLEYIKAKKTKRTAAAVSIGIGGTALVIMIVLFLFVNVAQKQHLKALDNDIKKYTEEIQNIPDIDKILTIQNQLKSLPDLHNKKVVSSRLFTYLGQLTPNQASISKADIDFTGYKLSLSGSANTITTVNKFADTLKFTTYTKSDGQEANAFSSVVLTNFNRDNSGKTSYQLDVVFDPAIFDSANEVKLKVPNIISTRSETEKPTELFQQNGGGQ